KSGRPRSAAFLAKISHSCGVLRLAIRGSFMWYLTLELSGGGAVRVERVVRQPVAHLSCPVIAATSHVPPTHAMKIPSAFKHLRRCRRPSSVSMVELSSTLAGFHNVLRPQRLMPGRT